MASYQQYRAPRENDQALVDPAWPDLLARLGGKPATVPRVSFGGQSLAQLRREARQALVADALDFTNRYANAPRNALERLAAGASLIVSGHQPDLFHPGVWFKNFALDSLAKASGGVGVHLLIDSDLCRETGVRVPTGSVASPRVTSVAYDRSLAAMPHEQRPIADPDLLKTFADRVAETVRPLVGDSLVHELWRHVGEASASDTPLGVVLSEGRHRLERAWGSETLELPAGVVADSDPFRRFLAELLLRAPQVTAAYNGALAEYRAAHKLRNTAQPLPDLTTDGDWCETPFWVWSDDQPIRRALFTRHAAGRFELSDRAGWQLDAPTTTDSLAGCLEELRCAGVKIRSRALVTTLYARLALADLFLHGIGGAKYDQVTDRFAERLFGEVPPAYATLTATLRLPIEHDLPTDNDRQQLTHSLREMRYHPERFLPPEVADDVRQAAELKASWIGVTDPAQRHERHRGITHANRRMLEALGDQPAQIHTELEGTERRLRDRAVLDSREYSFCLFPADDIRRRLTDLSRTDRD